MSSSIDTETELRSKAEKLREGAFAMEEAANVLQVIREQEELQTQEISNIKERVRRWLK